ncbi:MAG TPA: hypothetical protein VFU15_14725 [Bacteroidia bacterium]|nr:hypothetical protein [Bacteroidia bacterium]
MYRTGLLLFLWLIFFGGTATHTYSSFVADDEIVGFIHQQIAANHADRSEVRMRLWDVHIIPWDSADVKSVGLADSMSDDFFLYYEPRYTLDSVLQDSDKIFMRKQVWAYSGKKQDWQKEDLRGVKLIQPVPPDQVHIGNEYWEFSLPVFSKDHNWCIAKYEFVCGSRCIDRRTFLYKKSAEGNWLRYKLLRKDS